MGLALLFVVDIAHDVGQPRCAVTLKAAIQKMIASNGNRQLQGGLQSSKGKGVCHWAATVAASSSTVRTVNCRFFSGSAGSLKRCT